MRSYRPYRPGADDAALLRLRAEVWGADHAHTSQDFLHWLYVGGPAGRGGGVLAMDGDTAVGFAGILAREGQLGARAVRVAQCVDFMMHSGARGGAAALRIMVQWAQLARELGFAFGIGFPNARSHDLVTRDRLGWADAFWSDHLIRPLSLAAAPQGLLPRLPLSLVRGGTAVVKLACTARAAAARRPHPPGRAVALTGLDARIDALWQAACRDGQYHGLSRHAAYFSWRYLRHPVYRYALSGWEIDGRLAGCLVSSTRQLFSVPSLLLVDLLVDPQAPPGVTEALIEQLAQAQQAQHTPMLHALAVPGSPLRHALTHVGFVAIPKWANPKPFVMTVHDLAEPAPHPGDWRRWQFHWGDMDVV